jgi:hypothetical protein
MRQWCIGNIEASQALAPGSTPGWRSVVEVGTLFSFQYNFGGVAQMVERLLCMQDAQGSIPCSSKPFGLASNLGFLARVLFRSRGVSSVVEQLVAAR